MTVLIHPFEDLAGPAAGGQVQDKGVPCHAGHQTKVSAKQSQRQGGTGESSFHVGMSVRIQFFFLSFKMTV